MHFSNKISILKRAESMMNIYCFDGNALDPDEAAEGWRSVGVHLLYGMPFSSHNLYKRE